MKYINYLVNLKICVFFLIITVTVNCYSQNSFSKEVLFSVNQDGVTLSGSVKVAAQFVFLGAPYLKTQYSELTINSVSFQGELFNENSAYGASSYADKFIKFPYKFSNGSNKIMIEFPVYVAIESGSDVMGYQCSLWTTTNDYLYYHTTDVYGISDPSEVKEVLRYFKNNKTNKLSDSDLWECSKVDESRIKVKSLSANIFSEIRRKLDLAIDNKEKSDIDDAKKKKKKEGISKKTSVEKKDADDKKDASKKNIKEDKKEEKEKKSTPKKTEQNVYQRAAYWKSMARKAEARGDLNQAISLYEQAYNNTPNYVLKEKISSLRSKRASNAIGNIAANIVNTLYDNSERKLMNRLRSFSKSVENSEKNYQNQFRYSNNIHWKSLLKYVSEISAPIAKNSTLNSDKLYAMAIFKNEINTSRNLKPYDIKFSNIFLQYDYRIQYTNPIEINVSQLNKIPRNKRKDFIGLALYDRYKLFRNGKILNNLYVTRKFSRVATVLYAESKEELALMLKYAKKIDEAIIFEKINHTESEILKDVGIKQFSSTSLNNNYASFTALFSPSKFGDGSHVFYLKNSGILLVNNYRFILFNNFSFFEKYKPNNLEKHIANYNNWLLNRNKHNPLFPVATIDNRQYLPSMSHFSNIYYSEKNRKREVVSKNDFRMPELFYPNTTKINHFYVMKDSKNENKPGYIEFDYRFFTELYDEKSIYRPLIVFGKLDWDSKFNPLEIEGIIEFFPTLNFNKIDKEGSDRGSLTFTTNEKQDISRGYGEYIYHDKDRYFGIKCKLTGKKIGRRYEWETSKVKFEKYDIKDAKLGYFVEFRKYPKNFRRFKSTLDDFIKIKAKEGASRSTISTYTIEKKMEAVFNQEYISHYESNKSKPRLSLESIIRQPFKIKFFGNSWDYDLTDTQNLHPNGKTSFDIIFKELQKLMPKNVQFNSLENFQTKTVRFSPESPIEILGDFFNE